MATEKRLLGFDYQTFESFTRHMTKHREPYDQYDMGYVDAVDQIENWLEHNMVDAVEVVRCKDCKYWVEEKELGMFCGCWGGMLTSCKQDDFCSCGERKDNG